MKNILLLSILAFVTSCSSTRSNKLQTSGKIAGAWKLSNANEEQVLLFVDGYFTHTTYNKESKRFIQTRGGTYLDSNGRITVNYEFDTRSLEQIGRSVVYNYSLNNNRLTTNINGVEESWLQIDNGTGNLSGLWKISARRQEGNLVPIHQTGTRKTIKILSATRFQWAAIDPGTKEFMGTGGGTYTFSDGKYTEHIEFFSRDSTRVGNSLTFDGKLEGGDWHHSGLSSRGDPIYEVWSRKKE